MSKTRKRLFLVVLAALLAVLPAFADDVLYRTFPFAFQSAAAANGNGTANDVGALGTVVFVVTGTFSATVNFEATADNVRWDALQVSNISTGVTSNTATTPGTYWAPVAGLSKVRARVSNYASGTVTVTGRGAQARLNSPVASGGGGGGTTFPASADLSMGGYKLTNLADPTAGSQDAATAAFVQSQAAFVNVKATPGYDLLPAYTANGDNTVLTASANGALSIDYADLAVGDLVWLFYSAPVGIYEITALGDASHPWVLTRTAHSTPPVDGSFRTAIIYIYGGWYLQNSMWYYSVATGSTGWSPVFRDGQQVTKPGDIGTVQNGKKIGACPYYWSDGFLYGTPWYTKDSGQIANVADPVEAQDAATKAYVLARPLSDFAVPTSDLSLNSHKITNVTDPSGAQDAATKAYVDASMVGLAINCPVCIGSTVVWTQTAGTWTTDTTAGLYQNGSCAYNSTGSGANSDKITSSPIVVPISGNYTAYVLHKKGPDTGKWDLYMNGTQVGSTYDPYNATPITNVWKSFSLGALTAGTTVTFAFQMNGHNASSTNYYAAFQSVLLVRQ